MEVPTSKSIEFRKELLLVATLACKMQTPPPERIKCNRVLEHALRLAGEWNRRLESSRTEFFHGYMEGFPIVELYYQTLIGMTRSEPIAERLLDGAGNLDPSHPAGPMFTEGALTPKGEAVATRLLAQHPEWNIEPVRWPSPRD